MKTLTKAALFMTVMTAILAVSSADAWTMPCDESCFTTLGCSYVEDGYAVLNYYNRCDLNDLDCGAYDPSNADCQKWCQWELWVCCVMDDCIYCKSITDYEEGCFTQ